jgi:HEAT repeat protein
MAFNGLALLSLPRLRGEDPGDPETLAALRKGLDDTLAGVRVNAAVALALRGDESALPLLEQSLDRSRLQELGISDREWQKNALANAINAARHLGSPSLKPMVERLTEDSIEKDAQIRTLASLALREWRNR